MYVALNGVATLEGQFLANATNDCTFYHLSRITIEIERLVDVSTADKDSHRHRFGDVLDWMVITLSIT